MYKLFFQSQLQSHSVMERWSCKIPHGDIRTSSTVSPFFTSSTSRVNQLHVDTTEFFGDRVDYRVVGSREVNEDGTLTVDRFSNCKVEDADGQQFYVRNKELPFDEDRYFEFKGHRSLAKDECPRSSQSTELDEMDSTRKPVSSTLNAFLNTVHGGTVFLGVLDNGFVKGMLLTEDQKQHVRKNLEDLFSRFDPPASKNRWNLRFVPVVSHEWMTEDMDFFRRVAPVARENHDAGRRFHLFRSEEYCWCDRRAVEILRSKESVPPLPYVVEIEILPFATSERASFLSLYADENGKVFFRRNASNGRPMVEEIVNYLRHQVDQWVLAKNLGSVY